MQSRRSEKDDSQEHANQHPVRDGLIAASVYAAEVISAVQGLPPHVIATPTTPAGQPLITNEERDLADVKRKQDEDRLFDLKNAIGPPERTQRPDPDRDRRSDR